MTSKNINTTVACVKSNKKERLDFRRPRSLGTKKGRNDMGRIREVWDLVNNNKATDRIYYLNTYKCMGKGVVKMLSGKMVEILKIRRVRKENN